jgi:hypothetical protein
LAVSALAVTLCAAPEPGQAKYPPLCTDNAPTSIAHRLAHIRMFGSASLFLLPLVTRWRWSRTGHEEGL